MKSSNIVPGGITVCVFYSDIDECSDMVLACLGLDEICLNTMGSFHCTCAAGFILKDGVCVKQRLPSE